MQIRVEIGIVTLCGSLLPSFLMAVGNYECRFVLLFLLGRCWKGYAVAVTPASVLGRGREVSMETRRFLCLVYQVYGTKRFLL